ncbi:MAG: hypothetical protein SWH61_17590 [Thermodesulfobacteriota bacterium]|nr:hypothetical protein [Thermodesulfobacteriota bacterium]
MGQQLVLFGKYTHPGEVAIELTGRIDGEPQSWTCRALLPETDTTNPEIERLWALSAIGDTMEQIRLNGKSNRLCKRVIDLGTEYSLVTDYTSMVVMNEAEMEARGINRNNADRAYRERTDQAARANQPAKNYRVDNSNASNGMFHGTPSHSVGGGPVGPIFLAIVYWIRRRVNGK